jgi:hypothetical protein
MPVRAAWDVPVRRTVGGSKTARVQEEIQKKNQDRERAGE